MNGDKDTTGTAGTEVPVALPVGTPVVATATSDNPVVVRLKSLGVVDDVIPKIVDLGIGSIDDLVLLTEDMLVSSAVGMKAIPAKRLVLSLKGAEPSPNGKAAPAAAPMLSLMSILPQVPDDLNLLAALKIGGVLKVGETEVLSAVKAGLYDATQLNNVPKLLMTAMMKFAREQGEQVSTQYRALKRATTRRSYAEVFAALEGADGVTSVPKEERDYLMEQVLNKMFPALESFQFRLNQFVVDYRATGLDPMLLMGVLTGGASNPLLGITPPNVTPLIAASETVIDTINKCFAGEGCLAARALAFDAIETVKVLKEPGLPASIGAASYDHMLQQLGVNISSDFELLEKTVPQYALCVMQLKKRVTTGTPEELAFIAGMNQVGNQIPWELLTKKRPAKRPAGIGGRGRDEEEEE